MHKRRCFDRIWVPLLLAVCADTAWAMKCPPFGVTNTERAVQQKFNEASAVWVGRVKAIGDKLSYRGDMFNASQKVEFTVERWLKGRGGAEVGAVVPAGSAEAVGQRLLVFARPNTPQQRLEQTRIRWATRRQDAAMALAKGANGLLADPERFEALMASADRSRELVTVAAADIPLLTAAIGACEFSVFPFGELAAEAGAGRSVLPDPFDNQGEDLLWRLENMPPAGTGGRLWLSLEVEMAPAMADVAVHAEIRPAASPTEGVVGLLGDGQGERRFGVRWLDLVQRRSALSPVTLPPGSYRLELPTLPGYQLRCPPVLHQDECLSFTVADGELVLRKLFYTPMPAAAVPAPVTTTRQLDEFKRRWAQHLVRAVRRN